MARALNCPITSLRLPSGPPSYKSILKWGLCCGCVCREVSFRFISSLVTLDGYPCHLCSCQILSTASFEFWSLRLFTPLEPSWPHWSAASSRFLTPELRFENIRVKIGCDDGEAMSRWSIIISWEIQLRNTFEKWSWEIRWEYKGEHWVWWEGDE